MAGSLIAFYLDSFYTNFVKTVITNHSATDKSQKVNLFSVHLPLADRLIINDAFWHVDGLQHDTIR